MYRIFFVNCGWYSRNEGRDLEEAKAVCRRAGFQALIELDGETVATYCPLAGFHVRRVAA